MKNKPVVSTIMCVIFFIVIVTFSVAQRPTSDNSILQQTFDLAGNRLQSTQYYLMETKLITYALDGTIVGTDIYRLRLKCVPSQLAGKEGDKYTCVRFNLLQGDTLEVTIPALENWTYIFTQAGIDEKGQVFGIDHGKFENLVDSKGNTLSPVKAYAVYNTFIDFHGFCNVFAEPTPGGNGIQHLEKIGQKIVHSAAFTEPPINLGSNTLEGSFFKNGRITLEFKGLSLVNGRQCALIEYDSGESSFKMRMQPMPNMEIETVGSSHYMGDIYKDIETNWVQKVTVGEFVVSETTLPIPPNKVNSIHERKSIVRNVSEKEFLSN